VDTITPDRQAAIAENFADRRRHKRIAIMWMATLKIASGFFECLVIDLSCGGAKLSLPRPLALQPGDAVTLVFDGHGTFRAEAVWLRGSFAGVRFLEPAETVAAAFGDILAP
jgi:PilZ domain